MMPAPHLITTVGGSAVPTLEPMLRHYLSLGVQSIFLNLHLQNDNDPIRETVEEISRRCGTPITATYIGDWHDIQQEAYAKPRRDYPNDWFILADSDEFQQYPAPLTDIIAECEQHNWDHLKGCFLDRLAADGSFPPIDATIALEQQFPLGALLTFPVMLGDPRKITLVRGPIYVIAGQHFTYSPMGCPPAIHYIPVHHFKWTAGIPERLAERIQQMKQAGIAHWLESQRFLDYIEASSGRIDLQDQRLLIASCHPTYPHWDEMKQYVLNLR
ncbi:MAG: hypothetical protein U0R19_40230 [Bryobacteraceae bacterium]